ncbi:MAG: hypothetical protein V1721_05815 [Pseudomonadota bacterium]
MGKIQEVVPCPVTADRYLVRFSEYALVNIQNVWKGDRNPVKYAVIKDLGIDPSKLKWEPMPAATTEPSAPTTHEVKTAGTRPLTMAEAKKGLALTFGISPEAVEITICG